MLLYTKHCEFHVEYAQVEALTMSHWARETTDKPTLSFFSAKGPLTSSILDGYYHMYKIYT